MQNQVNVSGPDVHRTVSAHWKVSNRWGTSLGDVHEFHITRRGESVTILGPGIPNSITLRPEVARRFAGALLAAGSWKDDGEPEAPTKVNEADQ